MLRLTLRKNQLRIMAVALSSSSIWPRIAGPNYLHPALIYLSPIINYFYHFISPN